jgi:hypothetical protein
MGVSRGKFIPFSGRVAQDSGVKPTAATRSADIKDIKVFVFLIAIYRQLAHPQ